MLSGASKAPVGLEQHVTAIATPVGYALVARGRRPVPQAANYRWISFHCSLCRQLHPMRTRDGMRIVAAECGNGQAGQRNWVA